MHSMVGEQFVLRTQAAAYPFRADCLAGTLLGTAIWFIYYKLTPSLMHFLTKGSVGESGRSSLQRS